VKKPLEVPAGPASRGFCLRSKVSKQRGERQVRIRTRLDEEPMSLDSLHAAERIFARMAVRKLLSETSKSESAGPRLHRRAGRALTPQEGGPAASEREQSHEPTRCTL
jgi:hypothetical protein